MGKLMAGVGMASITPPVGYHMHCLGLRKDPSTGIHDDMKARALVLEAGKETLAIVALDVVFIPATLAADIRARVAELTGIGAARVMLSCSHDHTTPDFPDRNPSVARQGYDKYRALFVDLVAGAVSEAYHRREPASLGLGLGRLPGWSTNRRHPERPVDDSVTVLRVDRADGQPLACAVNFGCHALSVGGQYLWWTADFPGYMAQVVEKLYPGAACLFLQGAQGDIYPFDWYYGNTASRFLGTYADAQRIGFALGGEALRIMQGIETKDDVDLAAATRMVELPGRTVPWTAEEAAKVLAETMAAYPNWEAERWTSEVTYGNKSILAVGHYTVGAARAQLELASSVRPVVEAEVQVFRIGDAVLAAYPVELFNELGQEVKRRSPFAATLVMACANGSIGYVPAAADYDDLRGIPLRDLVDSVKYRFLYGVSTSRVNPGAGEKLVDAAVELMQGLADAGAAGTR